jgi:hypothetical protein
MTQNVDDGTIEDDEGLLRRIPPHHFFFDKNLGRWRPSSAAFDDHPDGSPMSVHLVTVLARHNLVRSTVLIGHVDYALARITAALVRSNRQGIYRHPLPDDPAHAEVFGPKSEGVRKRLAKGADWEIPPNRIVPSS